VHACVYRGECMRVYVSASVCTAFLKKKTMPGIYKIRNAVKIRNIHAISSIKTCIMVDILRI
jgi:hypothetical protein